MATLIRNVWVGDRYYGPDHGGDRELPAALAPDVPADAWSDGGRSVRVTDGSEDRPSVERATLISEARAKGLNPDRRWSAKRLRAEIDKASGKASHVPV